MARRLAPSATSVDVVVLIIAVVVALLLSSWPRPLFSGAKRVDLQTRVLPQRRAGTAARPQAQDEPARGTGKDWGSRRSRRRRRRRRRDCCGRRWWWRWPGPTDPVKVCMHARVYLDHATRRFWLWKQQYLKVSSCVSCCSSTHDITLLNGPRSQGQAPKLWQKQANLCTKYQVYRYHSCVWCDFMMMDARIQALKLFFCPEVVAACWYLSTFGIAYILDPPTPLQISTRHYGY